MDATKIDTKVFTLAGPDDDLRVDHLCQGLLQNFYQHLCVAGKHPVGATRLALGADLYLRNFLVDRMRRSPFDELPGMVRRFAGNWYVITTIEPTIDELGGHLDGIRELYRYLNSQRLISGEFCAVVEEECAVLEYYRQRIESFQAIAGDGYHDWVQACPLTIEPVSGDQT